MKRILLPCDLLASLKLIGMYYYPISIVQRLNWFKHLIRMLFQVGKNIHPNQKASTTIIKGNL